MNKRLLIVALFLIAYTFIITLSNAQQNRIIYTNSIVNQFAVIEKAEVFYDQENKEDILTIINKTFVPYKKKQLSATTDEGTLWIRLTLYNPASESSNLVLSATNNFNNLIKIYFTDSIYNIKEYTFGFLQQNSEKKSYKNINNIDIQLNPHTKIYLFIKVKSKFIGYLSFYLSTPDSYIKQLTINNVFQGILYGLFIFMILFAVSLWIYSKEIIYFYYFFGLFFYIFYFLALDNILTDLLFNLFGELFIKTILIFAQTSFVFFVFFSESFLEINKNDKVSRKLVLVLKSAMILNLFIILFWCSAGYYLFYKLCLIYCLVLSYITVKKNSEFLLYKKIFIIAQAVLLIFLILNNLAIKGIVNSKFLAQFSAHIGLSLQLTLLILALINRYIANQRNLSRLLRDKIKEKSAIYALQQAEIKIQEESLKEASEKMIEIVELKEGLTSMIIHDLKIPLHNIINCPEKLESGKQLHTIKQAGKNMLNLVNNILDVYKYEKSGLNLDSEDINVNSLINNVFEQVELLASQKNVTIYFNFPSNLSIYADYSIIERVFINLLTNAIKYTPANGRITVDYLELENKEFQFQIIDSGPGIPPEKKDLVFAKFGQILAKKTGEIRSTGLGLTFCKIAVEAHNGKIGFENLEPCGTKFWFTLPSVQFDKHEIKPNKTILITDRAEDYIKKISIESKIYLKPFISILSEIEIYHISRIRQVLKKIEDINNDIVIWKDLIIDAVYSNNQQLYQYLLKLDD